MNKLQHLNKLNIVVTKLISLHQTVSTEAMVERNGRRNQRAHISF